MARGCSPSRKDDHFPAEEADVLAHMGEDTMCRPKENVRTPPNNNKHQASV